MTSFVADIFRRVFGVRVRIVRHPGWHADTYFYTVEYRNWYSLHWEYSGTRDTFEEAEQLVKAITNQVNLSRLKSKTIKYFKV